MAHTPSVPATPRSAANRPSFIGTPGRACSPTRAHPGKGTTRPQTPPYVGTFRFRFRDQFRDHFSTFRRSAFSLPWPTRATRPRRRAPPLTDRHLSVLPAGRDAQHARARRNESRDSEFSLSTLSYRAAAYSRSTLRKRSSDSITKTRSDNSTARALKVPSSEAQAVECAGE